jgi:hypothetical protein
MHAAGMCAPTWINAAMWRWLVTRGLGRMGRITTSTEPLQGNLTSANRPAGLNHKLSAEALNERGRREPNLGGETREGHRRRAASLNDPVRGQGLGKVRECLFHGVLMGVRRCRTK